VIKYFRQFIGAVRKWWVGGKTIEHYQELYYLQSIAPEFQHVQSCNLESPTDWCLKGEELVQASQFQEAILCFEQVLKLSPRHVAALSGKGFCFYKMGYIKTAFECFSQALAFQPKDIGLLVNCGNCYCHFQEYDKALQCYKKALRYCASPIIWNNAGYCLVCLKRFEDACSAYRKAIKVSETEDVNILSNAAAAFLKSGKYREAMYFFDRSLQLAPQDDLLLNNAAVYLAFRNDYDQAVKCFDEAIHLQPDNSIYLCNKGMLLLEMGISDEAAHHFEEAINRDSSNNAAWKTPF
jgi:tetratricopeptide (TPR) repeat protein